MMPEINGSQIHGEMLAASIVAKVTVTTVLGLIAARLARRSRAAVRHALLAAAFGVLLLLPAASVIAPPIGIAMPKVRQARMVPAPFAAADGTISSVTPAEVGVPPAIPRSSRLSLSILLLWGWMAGATLFLLRMVMGHCQVRAMRRSGLAWPRGQTVAEALAAGEGIHRRLEVLLHKELSGPMTSGAMHPAIVLPLDARNWDEADLDRAMVHELEHVQRHDWVILCLARAVCAVYWFHPLVWIAWRQLTLEAERACDDAVLAGSEATTYADQLVGIAQRISKAAKSPLLAMANRADLGKCVAAVLDSRQRRGRAGVLPVVLACAAAAVLVLTMSPLRMIAAPQATMPRFSSSTMLVVVPVTVSDQNGQAVDRLRASDFALSEDGRTQRISVFEFQSLAGAAPGISSYYILGYYPANQSQNGEFRTLQVGLTEDTRATVRYRSGYYANRYESGGLDDATPGGSVPVLIYKPEPEYSEEARKAKFQGTVTLTVEVDAAGQTRNINVMRRLGLGLDEKAIEAVKQWRFKPGMMVGKPVPVLAQVDVSFRLL